jgi:hypothetical protein
VPVACRLINGWQLVVVAICVSVLSSMVVVSGLPVSRVDVSGQVVIVLSERKLKQML